MPGAGASPGGAIAAKVIGEHCPDTLSASEIAELESYLVQVERQSAAAERRKIGLGYNPPPFEAFREGLTERLAGKYRDPKNCDAAAAKQARDMVQQVRSAMAGGKLPDPADLPPDVGAVVSAKITGMMCDGAMTAAELARMELHVARFWTGLAGSAADADARLMMREITTAGATIMSGWTAKECTAEAIARAKDVLARLPKEP